MLITVLGAPTMIPSPLQLRVAVRFTKPLTTCPHAGFVDGSEVDAAAGITFVVTVSMLIVNSVTLEMPLSTSSSWKESGLAWNPILLICF